VKIEMAAVQEEFYTTNAISYADLMVSVLSARLQYKFWCRTPVWIAFSSGLVDSTAIPHQIRLLECVSDGGWLPDV
jgi:hypothetical protein